MSTEFTKYFTGESLYGDDFTEEEIKAWFDREAEAYANLYGTNIKLEKSYNFHNLNILYGFKYLCKVDKFEKVLGLGSSWGYEFLPIINRIENLFIIESSIQTRSKKLGEVSPIYKEPNVKGNINFEDNTFDLITCFDTLHHIPNVSFVLSELFRVLRPGGFLLMREPIHSMGDWRIARTGLTLNERGIPRKYLENIIHNLNFKIVKKHYYSCMTCFLSRLFGGSDFFLSKTYLLIDKYLSKLFSFNIHYHETNRIQRIAPMSVFYVLKK